MPTIPTRTFGRHKKYSGDGLSLLGTQPESPPTRNEITEVQLKWSPGIQQQGCTAPPCKYTFWWSSQPKTMVKKSAKAQK